MSTKTSTRLALGLLLLSVALATVAYFFVGLTWSTPRSGDLVSAPNTAINLAGALAFSFVGALIASRRPQNLVGWLFLTQGVYGCLQAVMERYVIYGAVTEPGSLPLTREAGAFTGATWVFNLSLIILLLILFPSGRAPSKRWKLVAYISVFAALAAYLGFMLEPGPLTPPFEDVENPLGLEPLEGIEVIGFAGLISLFALVLASTIAAILRFRRSRGEEREQFKWFVYAASFIPVSIAAHLMAEIFAPGAVELVEALFGFLFILIPAAVGIAVLKYRLYEIDVIINRTLVYVPLTAILAGLYVTMTGLSRTVFTELSGAGSDAAIAISTLAVVALLTPLKNQLQALVDRHFKEQHDPMRGVKQLTSQGRMVVEVMDTEGYVEKLMKEVAISLAADGAALELEGERLYGYGRQGSDAPLTLPIVHDDVRVGVLLLWFAQTERLAGTELPASITEAAAVLAHVLSLSPRTSAAVTSVAGQR